MLRLADWLTPSSKKSHDNDDKHVIWTAAEERQAMEEAQQQWLLICNDGQSIYVFHYALDIDFGKCRDRTSRHFIVRRDFPFPYGTKHTSLAPSIDSLLTGIQVGLSAALVLRALLEGERDNLEQILHDLVRCESIADDHRRRAILAESSSPIFRSTIYPIGTEYALVQTIAQLLYAVASVATGNSWAQSLKALFKARHAHTVLLAIRRVEIEVFQSRHLNDDDDVDFRKVTHERIDLFIHAATTTCLGLMHMLLSTIPLTLNKIVATIGFPAHRNSGVALLWSASNLDDTIFGAIAALTLSSYYTNGVAMAEVIPEHHFALRRSRALVERSKQMYPKSSLWALEQARTVKADRDLDSSVQILSTKAEPFPFRQIEAQFKFELALNLMFQRRFEDAAKCALECIELDKWSHGFYYYMAAISYIELYRATGYEAFGDGQRYAQLAAENFELVASNAKQRIIGRRAPWDAFFHRAMRKWRARSHERKCSLVDAVGVSPCQELMYHWYGYRCMPIPQLSATLADLHDFEDPDKNPHLAHASLDDLAFHAVLKAACLRHLGRIAEAKAVLQRDLFVLDQRNIRACPHAHDYAWPCGHYEMGCCLWQEANGEFADPQAFIKCKHHIDICVNWGDFANGPIYAIARDTLNKHKHAIV